MILVFMLLSLVAVQVSPLDVIEHPPVQCSQEGLSCTFYISLVKPNHEAPSLPEMKAKVILRTDDSEEKVPVLFLQVTQPWDAGIIYTLQGTEVHVLEVTSNRSLCARYTFPYKLSSIVKQYKMPWSFTLDRIVVDPGLKYQVSVSNLPKPNVRRHPKVQNITVPACTDPEIQKLKVCLENGSLWEPNLTCSVTDSKGKRGITVTFNTGQFSELYRVVIHHPDFSNTSLISKVLKDNRTSVSVHFPLNSWQLKLCDFVVVIKPFFVRCMNSCLEYQKRVQIRSCPSTRQRMVWTVFSLSALILCALMAVQMHNNSNKDLNSSPNTTDKEEVQCVSVQSPNKVLILYSLDHPLYKEIILKLCAFLRAKCGTDVTLDLLDFSLLSIIGSMQWLDMQRESLSRSSDKVLILCSPGVYAKWKGMCGGYRVMTKEDVLSPMGDMLTPALSLIVLDFVNASSFQKYIVAYFDDVCSEKDVPAPFNMAVKYQLMKHFEELFFRLVDKEKHEPGRIKQVEGIREDDYFHSSHGRALKEAIKAFQAFQLTNPKWFEMELVDENGEVKESGHEQDGGAEMDCNSVLENQLWVRDNSAPLFVNKVRDQMHEAQPQNTEYTASEFSLNEIYPTVPHTH